MLSALIGIVLAAGIAGAGPGDDPADAAPPPDKLEDTLPDEELKDEELKDEELKDGELKDEELKDEELKDEELKDGELKDEVRPEEPRSKRPHRVDDSGRPEAAEDDSGYTRRRNKPARAGGKRPQPDDPRERAEVIDDVGVVERYLPLTLSDPLVPELEDGWVWFVVGGLFAGWGGHLLLPLLAVTMQDDDGKAPEGYYSEAFKILIAHAIPHVVLFGVMACAMPLVFIPIVGTVLFIVAWVLNVFVNLPLGLCNALWLTPVALANAYNRRSMAEQRAPRTPRGRRGRAPDRQAF